MKKLAPLVLKTRLIFHPLQSESDLLVIQSLGQTTSSLSEFEFPTTDVDDSTMLPFLDHVALPYYVRGCTYIT